MNKGGKKIEVDITPDKLNLDAYVSYNKGIAKQLIKAKQSNLPVTITFNRPMDLNEIEQYIQSGITVSEYIGRAFKNSERFTFAGVTNNLDTIQSSIDTIFDEHKEHEIAGIFALHGTINDASMLESLLNDANIYLIDLTQIEYKEKIQGEDPYNLPIEFEVHSPYWYIES